MNPVRLSAFVSVIFSISIFSCKKNDHTPPPSPDILDSLHINLDFPKSRLWQPTDTSKYELIITEPGGKVLMDTITHYNTPIMAWLKTNHKLLDITTVQKWNASFSYLIRTYKAIDLTSWINIPHHDSIQFPTSGIVFPPSTSGIVAYQHVNIPMGNYYNFLAYGRAATGQVYDNILYGNYNAPIGEWAYLIFPDLGLYNLHKISSNYDYVDFSSPDTATRVKFNKPAIYTRAQFSLFGYPDTNYLPYNVNLAYFSASGNQITNATELVYPGKKGFKKYSFAYHAADANDDNFASVYLPYIDTIPGDLTIPQPSWYTSSLTPDTSLVVGFGSHKPTYYEVTSTIDDMRFIITAPGDSTVLRLTSLGGVKSKLLGSRVERPVHPDYLNIVTYTAEPSYLAYWVKRSKIYQAWKEPDPAYTTFQRRLYK